MDSLSELCHSCISETILAPSFLLFGKNFNIMSCLLVLPYTMEIANYKKKKKRVFALFYSRSQILWMTMRRHPAVLLLTAPALWTFWTARAMQFIVIVEHEFRVSLAIFFVIFLLQFIPIIVHIISSFTSIYVYESFCICKSAKWMFLTAWIDMQLRK